MNLIEEAEKVFDAEIHALTKTRDHLGGAFENLVGILADCKGKVVVSGIGKSGHIAKKMAATFSSLGTPSFFMHPSEALHGDLGMVTNQDVILLISHSGESEEILRLLPALHAIACKIIAITGNEKSSLVRECNDKYVFPDFKEACYLGLAPTSSTTALLAFGDALAVVLSRIRNYTKDDFALHHPAGALGKKLLVRVKDIMHADSDNAIIFTGSMLQDAIIKMSQKRLNMVNIVDQDMQLLGIITDGDLRRLLEKGLNVYGVKVDSVMTLDPKVIYFDELAVNALQMMNDHRISCLPVINETNRVVGSLLLQDIYSAGIIG